MPGRILRGPDGPDPTNLSGLGRRATRAVLWRCVDLGATRIVSLVRFLVLARLLDPEDFGLLAIAAGALELLLTLTEVGVSRALIQRRDASERDYDVAWTIGLVRAAVVFVVLVVTAPQLASMLGDERATGLLRALAAQPLLASLESIGVASAMRDLRFSAITVLDVGAALAEAVIAIALAPTLGVPALVIAALTAAVLRTALSYVVAPHHPRLHWERRRVGSLMAFGKWVFLGYLFSIIGDTMLRAAIGRRLGTADLGLFYLGARLALLPNQIVAELVTPVAFSVHARAQDVGAVATRAVRASLSGMVTLLGPVTGVLVGLASPLTDEVLGDEWRGAAAVLAILALDGLVTIPVDVAEPLLEGSGRPHRVALVRGVRAAAVLVLAWWLTGALGLAGAALAALVAEVLVVGAATFWTRDLWWAVRHQLGRMVAAGLLAASVSCVVSLVLGAVMSGITGVGLAAVAGTASGWLVLAILDRLLDLEVRSLVLGTVRGLRRPAAPAPDEAPR